MSLLNRFLSVLKILMAVLIVPIESASYCFYYRYRYVCYYYYKYYRTSSYTGTIAGAIIGGIVGIMFISFVVVVVCVKICKKTNHGQVLVNPHPSVLHISSEQHGYPVPTAPSYSQPAVYNAPPSYSSFNTYNAYPPPYAMQSPASNEQTGTQFSNPT